MQTFRDYNGNEIILADSAREHIATRHREIPILGLEHVIGERLLAPDIVIQTNSQSRHYYRWYVGTEFGDKYVCVIMEIEDGNSYIRTSYVTSRVTRGSVIWERQ